ncbi:MAG: NADH-quinone oxidoreductase subunit N [Bacteroidetes bacterium B1(2017)]|nr:MAG: NADH-quinone oxidoreductase subunit N [Bacteroidetes bacterium B1(2017)]
MLAEIFNWRKLIVPALVLGLAVIFGLNLNDWNTNQAFYNNMLKVDNFSVAFSGLAIFVTLLIFILSTDFYAKDQEHLSDYMSILTFILVGALMMFSFSNLTMLFLGIETLSIALYIMAGSKRFDVRSNEAGFKYFLMGSFASCFLLFGITLIYGATGTFDLAKIADYTIQNQHHISPLFYTGMVLMVFAMLFKVSAAPFHFWAPDVYEGAPALITAYMSTLVKIAAFAAFYKLMSATFFYTSTQAELILNIAAILTLAVGNLMALSQTNFKRLLAYSGISHAGYMMLLILSAQNQPAGALFYYALAYSLSTLAAFAIAIPVFKAAGSEEIDSFNGLAKKNPVQAAAMSMAMLGLAGIPPFAGFLGKYYIFTESLHSGFHNTTLVAIFASMIGVYYYFKVIIAMYGKPANEAKIETSINYQLVLWVCLALSIAFGLYPAPILNIF